jgi:hypothetical protein
VGNCVVNMPTLFFSNTSQTRLRSLLWLMTSSSQGNEGHKEEVPTGTLA